MRTGIIILVGLLLVGAGCGEAVYKDKIYDKPEIVKDPPSDYLTPEETLKSFYLPEGFKIELAASEPLVHEPVAITWDGNGRLYVAQMDTYMQNVDGDGTDEPVSQVRRLEDTDGDGKMDKSTVFIDSLVLPRMILALDDRILVNETYSYDLWSYRDTDNDGVADEKINLYSNPERRGGNLEHQQSGLIWNLDNWIYMTTLRYRFRFDDDKLIIDTLDYSPGGQWGLTQDDMGAMYYSAAGGERPAFGFQQTPVYGPIPLNGTLAEGFSEPWPVVGTPDVQGGAKSRLREDGTLNHFTGIAGQEIYRGHKLPPSVYGDLFIPEPVGRLIRRAKVNVEDGKKVLYNAYDKQEFLASRDLNFRPVQAKTGPDGCLYIVDMHRGIIQESNWTKEGSHIRPVILRKGLDRNIGKGRIYRIVHEQIEPDKKPHLLDESVDDLLGYLGHPNGWYRNTAQKLIILKNDQSVVPALKKIALNNETFWTNIFGNKDYGLERVHALWTLEGLRAIDQQLVMEKLNDVDSRVRITAIRLCDDWLRKGDMKILSALSQLQSDTNVTVVNQLALSLRFSDSQEAVGLLNTMLTKYENHEVISTSILESLKKGDANLEPLIKKIAKTNGNAKNRLLKGYEIYSQLCVTCHGPNLMGAPKGENALIAPPLIGSPRVRGDKETLIKILLNGLSGPIDGKEYGDIMMPLGANDDDWIANVASYVRILNDTTVISSAEVGSIREKYKEKHTFWTIEELMK